MQMGKIAKEIKSNIQILVNAGALNEAKSLLDEYRQLAVNDIETYSIEAIIFIMENKLDKAEQCLNDGLAIDKMNFDLLYNLAHVYKQQEKFNNAFKYYKKALGYSNDETLKAEIKNIIFELENEHEDKIEREKSKIVFFDKGDDKFIWDIINELSKEYETKHIRVTDYKQIDEGMEWADICWFEWCDELVIYGSKLVMAREKKIICRLHSYEAFTEYPSKVDWDKVNKLIFIAEHIKKFVSDKFKIHNRKLLVIPNGIDINKWKFAERKQGFNVAYVGYINYKKGPMLLLQTFKAIYDKDHRYKLYIAGKFQDDRDVLYFQQMIKEFGIEKNVIYEGWQNNLDEWLQDKNFILCTSILESQNMSVMQAMAKGIKPIVHNFVGAKNVYPKEYVWNAIDEAVEMLQDKNYNSSEYRKFILDKYPLDKQINRIKSVIENLNTNEDKNICGFTYNGIEIKFYLPYLNDWIQNVIYKTNNFYELGMLIDIKNRLGENKIVVDIGANIGNHTVFFSKICKAKKVYSFEPQANIFKILKKNVEVNEISNIVELHNMGLGKERSFANVTVVDENNYGMSRLDKTEQGTIEINSLDNIFINRVAKIDMIKIDVEGMELEVLEGAKIIINKFKPLIYIEAGTDEEFTSVSEFFNEFGYKPVYKFNATPTYLFIYK